MLLLLFIYQQFSKLVYICTSTVWELLYFCIIALPVSFIWGIVFQACISVMTKRGWISFLNFILDIWIFSFMVCLFKSFAHFYSFSFLLICRSYLYNLDTNHLLDICIVNFLLLVLVLSWCLLMNQKFLVLMESNLTVFSFVVSAFCVLFEVSSPVSWRYSVCVW